MKSPPTRIQLDRHEALTVTWRDASVSVYPVDYLRQRCPCATCRETREETNPLRILSDDMLTTHVHVVRVQPVGRYAISLEFSDGHATGIYSFQYLEEIAPSFQNA